MPQVGRGWRRGRRGPRRRAGRRAGGRRAGCRGCWRRSWAACRRRPPRQFGEVLRQFLLGGAPGEVRVGLLEADLGEGVHHRRAGEGLRQEDDVGVGAVDLPDDPFPEDDRLGVRVVHPEDPHSGVHPVPQDPAGLRDQPVHVGVEGDGVDVLVLLRRVLRVGDGAVGPVVEPLGVLVHPGVVGEHCRAKSRATSMPRSRARATKRVKSSSVPSRGCTASWPPSGSRSPTARRRRRGRRRGCCSGPCGTWCRWGGSGAGRRRRSPSWRSRAAVARRCRRCRAAVRACPPSAGRTRTTSRTGHAPAPPAEGAARCW